MADAIPVIDLSQALARGAPGSGRAAARLREAAMGSGFFYVVNHGVEAVLVERQFELARALFDLPQADKDAISLDRSPAMRGYERIGAQTLDADARPDLKESFYCGPEHPRDHPYVRKGYSSYGANQWPAQLPDMAAACQAYIARMQGLAVRLMELMALSLALPEGFFDEAQGHPMMTLRLLRYPPHPADADAHTDWGAITLLAQDDLGGLEVCMPDGSWVPATPLAGSLVVNLGDMIPRWTNGRYHSNPHRVRNVHSHGRPRYSVPFFYSPDYEARVEPVATCVPAGEAPRYTPCTVGEHLREMYARTYGLKPQAEPA